MSDPTSAPLLRSRPEQLPTTSLQPDTTRRALHHFQNVRRNGRVLLASRKKHFVVMLIVTLDVMALLANIFIQLIACEMHQRDENWVQMLTKELENLGLVFSSLFMVELAACLFSYGFSYLASWFHFFDAAVIVVSFAIDIASHGLAESIGSLVVVLRLWRLAKISEEVVLGATERLELMEQQMEELEHENRALRQQMGIESHEYSGHE
ncbi:hypothetical protein QQS21_008993 [Conoideocrella luteorostrata]|uniref:Voltage-gated hydrogen channel 1 n=1 Tax=Conoideocrella luteorostrata TaxID=1105319 RepID=A0AAJ0CHU7_9HYPO|nr:hypothetical protein QQS21_008993 [Conoideocrella luteorostrata]